MVIIKTKNGEDELVVKPMGRIDVNVAYQFEHEVKGMLTGIKSLIIDFDNVEYISSIGLRVLLEFQKQLEGQGTMKIKNVKSDILEIFKIVGFDKILTID